MPTLRLLTWNLAFASRKKFFIEDDAQRAKEIAKIISGLSPHIVALQEVANRTYGDGTSFRLSHYLIQEISNFEMFFQSALSLPLEHSNPYGKAELLKKDFNIVTHEQGIGLLYCSKDITYRLSNLYSSDKGEAKIEITSPLPQVLYMGNAIDEKGAGRDDEHRPVLWSRWRSEGKSIKIFFLSLHLPTLKGERSNTLNHQFTSRQLEIRDELLKRSDITHIDELGVALRCYYLRNLMLQAQRLEDYWKAKEEDTKVVFILAGDFNFDHNVESEEKKILQQFGFFVAKKQGASKNSGMLLDNIWIKSDFNIKIKSELLSDFSIFKLSDHFPLFVELIW